jgi:hypothetical protein
MMRHVTKLNLRLARSYVRPVPGCVRSREEVYLLAARFSARQSIEAHDAGMYDDADVLAESAEFLRNRVTAIRNLQF